MYLYSHSLHTQRRRCIGFLMSHVKHCLSNHALLLAACCPERRSRSYTMQIRLTTQSQAALSTTFRANMTVSIRKQSEPALAIQGLVSHETRLYIRACWKHFGRISIKKHKFHPEWVLHQGATYHRSASTDTELGVGDLDHVMAWRIAWDMVNC